MTIIRVKDKLRGSMLNEMMDKPIVKENIVEYMRSSQRSFEKDLDRLQMWCNRKRIPIIPHETAVFLDFQLGLLKPNRILEIGTAVGFSTILMARHLPEEGQIFTIERHDIMSEKAKENFKKFGLEKKIKLFEDDAKDVLPSLDETFDFIFMDSAKSKYVEFFPYCMKALKVGGIMIVDDIFQAGTILDDISEIPRRARKIHKRLNQFLDLIQNDEALKSTLIPLGDGIVMIQKIAEKDYSFIFDQI